MERKRIGNDIKLRWAVYNPDGTPVDFSGKTVEVEIRHAQLNKRYPQEVEISGNLIDLQFTAEEQTLVGIYNLWLQYTYPDDTVEGGKATVTLDNCNALELVAKSCQLAGINDDPIYLEGIVTGLSYSNLTEAEKQDITDRLAEHFHVEDGKNLEFNWDGTRLGVRQEGQTEYQYVDLKGQKGDAFTFDDFTPEQIEILQQPAAEAASTALAAAGMANEAAEVANDTANHPTYVGEDNFVYVWDKNDQEYKKTDIYVKGDDGDTIINQHDGTPIKLWLSPISEIPSEQEPDIIYIGYENQ